MTGVYAGRLNRRIVLQRNTPAQDAYGTPIESWATIATVWAARATLDNTSAFKEQFSSDVTIGVLPVVWRIRYRSDIDNLCRVTYGGNSYDILGVEEKGLKDSLLLITKAIIGR